MKKHARFLLSVCLVAALSGLSMWGCTPSEATADRLEVDAVPPSLSEPVPVLAETAPAEETASVVQAAIKTSAEAGKYLFVFVAGDDTPETLAVRNTFEEAVSASADQANVAFIDLNSDAEKEFIDEFALDHAPVPIVLAMAPAGVITGAAYGEQLNEPQLETLMAGPTEQQVLKSLQDQKLVLVCLQNQATTSNEAAMQGVNEFKQDERFAEFTEVVKIDPASEADRSFLAKLPVDPEIQEATTLFLAPPNRLITKVEGATNKDTLFAALMAGSQGGCCSVR